MAATRGPAASTPSKRSKHIPQNAQKQHRYKGSRCSVKIYPADAPHPQQRRKINESEHPRSRRPQPERPWQVQQPRKEKQAQRESDRCKDKRERSVRTRLIVDGRRAAACHGISMSEGLLQNLLTDAEKFSLRPEAYPCFAAKVRLRTRSPYRRRRSSLAAVEGQYFGIAQAKRGTLKFGKMLELLVVATPELEAPEERQRRLIVSYCSGSAGQAAWCRQQEQHDRDDAYGKHKDALGRVERSKSTAR